MPIYKLPGLVMEGKREYHKASAALRAAEGMREALAELKESGYTMGILSSNTKENIHGFLKLNALDVFDAVHSASNVFGKDKAIRGMAREMGIGLDRIVYVGDELRDVQACRKIGVTVIAVSWGYDSAKLLAEAGPNHLCHTAAELLDIVRRRL